MLQSLEQAAKGGAHLGPLMAANTIKEKVGEHLENQRLGRAAFPEKTFGQDALDVAGSLGEGALIGGVSGAFAAQPKAGELAPEQSATEQPEPVASPEAAAPASESTPAGTNDPQQAPIAPDQVDPSVVYVTGKAPEPIPADASTPNEASTNSGQPAESEQPEPSATDAPPPAEPPTEPVDAETKPAEMKDRKSMVNVLADPDTSEKVKQTIRDEGIDKYVPESLAKAEKHVDDYLRDSPLADAVAKAVESTGSDMHGAVRTLLRAKVLQKLGTTLDAAIASGDTEAAEAHNKDASKVALAMGEGLTDAGREVNAAKILSRYSPETVVYRTQREFAKQGEAVIKKAGRKLKGEAADIHKSKVAATDATLASAKVGDAAKAVADEAVNGKKAKGKPAAPAADAPADAPAWGSKNKLFTKESAAKARAELRNKGLSSIIPPELIHYMGFYMEAGVRSFADVSKRVLRDLGQKFKPMLKDAYEKAKAELIAKGDSGHGFDGPDAVTAALNKELGNDLADRIVSAAAPKKAGVFDPVREMLDTLTKKVSETLPKAAGCRDASAFV